MSIRNAFFDLNVSRPRTDFGEGFIPLSEISAYCELFGVTDIEDRADFVRCIRAMDAAYLDFRAEQRADKEDKPDEPPADKAKKR